MNLLRLPIVTLHCRRCHRRMSGNLVCARGPVHCTLQGSPDTVRGSAIQRANRMGVRLTSAGLELTANAGGVTTPGSRHSRSEMRELSSNGKGVYMHGDVHLTLFACVKARCMILTWSACIPVVLTPGQRASWGNRDGRMHTMELDITVTRLPAAKPAATIMQIKDNVGNEQNVGIEVVPKERRGNLRGGLKLQVGDRSDWG
jgi:hypothetical protein